MPLAVALRLGRAGTPARIALGLALAHVALIWLMPALPAQDLPQHLAYGRILRDYPDPGLPFSETYAVAERFQPYFTTHYLMAAIGRFVGIEQAARLLLSLYALGMMAAFAALVRAFHPRAAHTPWTVLLGSLLIWTPVACMGFLQFLIALPVVLFGCALIVSGSENRPSLARLAVVAGLGVLAVSLHAVAAGCLALFAAAYAVLGRGPYPVLAPATTVAAIVLTFLGWESLADGGLGSMAGVQAAEAIRAAHGLEFINDLYRIRWSSPPVLVNYVLWNLLGPYPPGGMMASAAAVTALLLVLAGERGPQPQSSADPRRTGRQRTVLALFVVAVLLPWGLYTPTEITFLNFRVLTFVFALALACSPPEWCSSPRARAALAVFVAFAFAHLAVRSAGFAGEARPVFRLLAEARPAGSMMSLVCHGRSQRFAKQFHVTRFLPMHYTVRHGGLNSQFWAGYTHHLPVDYRAGRRFDAPAEWRAAELRAEQLAAFDHVLLQAATDEDPRRIRDDCRNVQRIVEGAADRLRCEDLWCLYRVRRAEK